MKLYEWQEAQRKAATQVTRADRMRELGLDNEDQLHAYDMLKRADWTYMYSDDPEMFERGGRQRNAMRHALLKLTARYGLPVLDKLLPAVPESFRNEFRAVAVSWFREKNQ